MPTKSLLQGYALWLFLFSNLLSSRVSAYPTFIGYGYQSCHICHFNPLGNGPLTDYGRALGASVISDNKLWAEGMSDEDLGLSSNFFGRKKSKYFKPAADFRGLLLMRNLETSQSSTSFIPMQADLNLTISDPGVNYWTSMTLGYHPKRGANANQDRAPLISREHYLAAKINRSHALMAGFMDIPFGIRIPDHTAYSRSTTNLTMNDQSHQFLWSFFGKSHDLALSLLLGNLFQESPLRQKGASFFFEYEAFKNTRLGLSSLWTQNEFRSQLMNAVHARIGASKGTAVLIEIGTVYQKTDIPSSNFKSYFLFQNMVRLARGFNILLVGEYFTENTFQPDTRQIRIGPTLQYFVAPRLEIRADFQASRVLGADTIEEDQISFLSQIHLWF